MNRDDRTSNVHITRGLARKIKSEDGVMHRPNRRKSSPPRAARSETIDFEFNKRTSRRSLPAPATSADGQYEQIYDESGASDLGIGGDDNVPTTQGGYEDEDLDNSNFDNSASNNVSATEDKRSSSPFTQMKSSPVATPTGSSSSSSRAYPSPMAYESPNLKTHVSTGYANINPVGPIGNAPPEEELTLFEHIHNFLTMVLYTPLSTAFNFVERNKGAAFSFLVIVLATLAMFFANNGSFPNISNPIKLQPYFGLSNMTTPAIPQPTPQPISQPTPQEGVPPTITREEMEDFTRSIVRDEIRSISRPDTDTQIREFFDRLRALEDKHNTLRSLYDKVSTQSLDKLADDIEALKSQIKLSGGSALPADTATLQARMQQVLMENIEKSIEAFRAEEQRELKALKNELNLADKNLKGQLEPLRRRLDSLSADQKAKMDSIEAQIKDLSKNTATAAPAIDMKQFDDKMQQLRDEYAATKEQFKQDLAAAADQIRQETQKSIDELRIVITNAVDTEHKYTDSKFKELADREAKTVIKLDNVNELAMLQESDVISIVKREIDAYAADRINKTDFALLSVGSKILDHSPSHAWVNPWESVSSFLDWWSIKINPPETILQPDTTLGNCWAFSGKSGFVVVRLSYPIIPSGFSIDHVDPAIAPDFSSAPKDFRVYGYADENTDKSDLLGKWTYEKGKGPVQTFDIKTPVTTAYPIYMLHIDDNHGNKDYTCVYRFRVHGQRVPLQQIEESPKQ